MPISSEKLNPPILTYKSITRGSDSQSYSLNDTIDVSENEGFNKITIVFSSNVGLNRFVINSVKGTDILPDIEIGTRLVTYPDSKHDISTPNTDIIASFDINKTIFNEGDGIYTIFMCAQSALDYSWDITYLFMVKVEGSSEYQGISPKISEDSSSRYDNTEVLIDYMDN